MFYLQKIAHALLASLHGRELVLHSGSVREANLFSSSLVQTFLELDLVDKPVYTGSSSLLGEYVLVMLDLNRLPGATPFNKLMVCTALLFYCAVGIRPFVCAGRPSVR